ncbi:MAG: hypothetical protein FWB88_03495 [Defluviitaleaceae bacterium]|nr:hypothetical protein [Defluviitaleaceae bacterium]
MKRILKLLLVLAAVATLMTFASCAREEPPPPPPPPAVTPAPPPAPPADGPVEVAPGDPRLARHGLDENLRFIEPVTIRAQVWCRSNDRVPVYAEGYWARWVQARMLEEHNVIVEFENTPRWPDHDHIVMLLGAGDAPDVSFGFHMGPFNAFRDMGGITDLAPYLAQYRDWLPNLYGAIGETLVYWNMDPDTGALYSIQARMVTDGRLNTFVREDWLHTLGIAPPTNMAQFEAMLVAFRDNAELLLGASADQMIPFRLSSDVGWTGDPIITSFIPDNISEREWFRYGFDDRRFMMPGIKEGVRILNRWYSDGLIWRDFPLYDLGDPFENDIIAMGIVGAFVGNWDFPFRANPGIITTMQEEVGPEANFIAVAPFHNQAGNIVMHMPPGTDRAIFFPSTNENVVASLLYLDFLGRVDTRTTLAFGYEGIHHVRLANGAFQALPADDVPDDMHIVSLRNFDLALLVNGVDLGDDEISALTVGLGYPGIEAERVAHARALGLDHARVFRRVQFPPISAEEGMATPLADLRNQIFAVTIAATSPEDFDATWDRMFEDYMAIGGRAIINERDRVWVEMYGNIYNRPGIEDWHWGF